MATNDETFVLVEMSDEIGALGGSHQRIKRIVRTYLSRSRADEDLALLCNAMPDCCFNVAPVEHIDN